jgi:hypothetical protein
VNSSSPAQRHPSDGPIDGPTAVRAASTGFTILLLGGLLTPIAARFLPVVGQFWLSIVAVVAFAVAGHRIGTARIAPLHGACAALGGYLIVLPLVLWTSGGLAGLGLAQILWTAAAALFVGALAGFVAGRRRDASPAD